MLKNLLDAGARTSRSSSTATSSGSGNGGGGLPPNKVARTLCSKDAFTTLLRVGETFPTHLPTIRPVLHILTELLGCSGQARALVAGSAATMGRLRALRSLHRGALTRLRTNATAQTLLTQLAQATAARAAGTLEEPDFLAFRAQCQQGAAATVGMVAGSEGFSLEATVRLWDVVFNLLR